VTPGEFARLLQAMPVSEYFRRILVPVDFAEADEGDETDPSLIIEIHGHRIAFATSSVRAVQLAAGLARASGGALRLIHATPPMQTSSIYTGPVAVPAQIIDEIHQRARTTSQAALDELAHTHGQGLAVEVVVSPANPIAMVLEHARTWNADLIVMAASGRSRVARFFVGSTADRVIRQADCPVLVVPSQAIP
jgi:nucleotide-binding universal stress UspA family protein